MIQLFEAIAIGLVLILVLFHVLALEPPSNGEPRARLELQRTTEQTVSVLARTSYADPSYDNNLLSVAMSEALRGDATRLETYLEGSLPAGAQYNVYVSNGHDRIPVRFTHEPEGMTAGTSYRIEPRWRSVYTAPVVDTMGAGDDTPLELLVVPTFSSNTVADPNALVSINATGVHPRPDGTPATYNTTAWAETTTEHATAAADHAVAVVRFACDNGAGGQLPCWSADLTASPPSFEHDDALSTWRGNISVDNEGTEPIPAGTRIRVDFPPGMEYSLDTSEGTWLTDWDLVDYRRGAAGSNYFIAELTSDIDPADLAQVPFDIHDPVTDARTPFRVVQARLTPVAGGGAGAVATTALLPVRVTDAPSVEAGLGIHANIPHPSAPTGDTATWVIVVTTPRSPADVKHVTISAEGLGVRFDCASTTVAGDGEIEDCSPTRIHWKGPDSGVGGLTEIRLNVASASAESVFVPTSRNPVTVTFPDRDAVHVAGTMVAPNVYRAVVPPMASGPHIEGYPEPSPAVDHPDVETLDVRSATTTVRGTATGTATYNVTGGLDDALEAVPDAVRSLTVTANPHVVPMGETVSISVDVGKLKSLIKSDNDATLTDVSTRIIAPWGLADGTADTVVPLDVGDSDGRYQFQYAVPRSSGWGTHVVETRVTWTADVPDGSGGEVTVTETARIMTTFQVASPDGATIEAGILAPSPTYGLEVIAWMSHWG